MIPASRIKTVVNGIDCKRFQPGNRDQAIAFLKLDPSRIWILCVGQARPEKRFDWVIRSARKIIDTCTHLNVGFIYVGDGVCKPILEEIVNSLGLESDFFFAGQQDDLVPYYQAASLMVHAASRESFGLAIVEAMACGLPVVATAAAGPSEIIVNNQTGVSSALNDEEAFYTAILKYVNDERLRATHGEQARQHAVSNFSIERQARQIADYIRSTN